MQLFSPQSQHLFNDQLNKDFYDYTHFVRRDRESQANYQPSNYNQDGPAIITSLLKIAHLNVQGISTDFQQNLTI